MPLADSDFIELKGNCGHSLAIDNLASSSIPLAVKIVICSMQSHPNVSVVHFLHPAGLVETHLLLLLRVRMCSSTVDHIWDTHTPSPSPMPVCELLQCCMLFVDFLLCLIIMFPADCSERFEENGWEAQKRGGGEHCSENSDGLFDGIMRWSERGGLSRGPATIA